MRVGDFLSSALWLALIVAVLGLSGCDPFARPVYCIAGSEKACADLRAAYDKHR